MATSHATETAAVLNAARAREPAHIGWLHAHTGATEVSRAALERGDIVALLRAPWRAHALQAARPLGIAEALNELQVLRR